MTARLVPPVDQSPAVTLSVRHDTPSPVRREAVSDQLYAVLRDRILGGALLPGSPLTAERDLAAEFRVNRHAVREAVKRLQQARLIEVSHGGRTLVLDWRRTAGLDLAPGIVAADPGPMIAELARDAREMRACGGPDAARLCALLRPGRRAHAGRRPCCTSASGRRHRRCAGWCRTPCRPRARDGPPARRRAGPGWPSGRPRRSPAVARSDAVRFPRPPGCRLWTA
ncbi:winged helix-turn-helix domain-containing protein [Streptomyces sp. NRRL F-2799]|uniref:FadR/GntR family transcriptional regulator n=1 Tax=Streptomyces sp. NRRL F-2799 TaxID=1463844 RepID=UPI0018FE09C2